MSTELKVIIRMRAIQLYCSYIHYSSNVKVIVFMKNKHINERISKML